MPTGNPQPQAHKNCEPTAGELGTGWVGGFDDVDEVEVTKRMRLAGPTAQLMSRLASFGLEISW